MKHARSERINGFRWSGELAGLRAEVQGCPDACPKDATRKAALSGLAAYGASWLLGAAAPGRLVAAAVGAAFGALAARHHVFVDWDPDAARPTTDDVEPSGGAL